jgi:hypothetical protein
MPDPDDAASALAGIRERYEELGPLYQNTHFMLDAVVQDVPRLVAAVDAVLKLTDEACELEVKGVRLDWWDTSPTRLRAAITTALAGEEAVP